MATLLYRLGKTAFRRWPFFVAGWLVALIAVVAVATGFAKPMTDAISIPGIPSERASELQEELFPESEDALDQATVNVVVRAPQGTTLSDPKVSAKVDKVVADIAALPQMPKEPQVANPVVMAQAQRQQLLAAAKENGTPRKQALANAAAISPLSDDGRVGIISFNLDVDSVADVEPTTLEELRDVLAEARDRGLTAEANGSGMAQMVEVGGASELVGVAVALVVLVLTFGSLAAAGLPIVTALVGVGIGVEGISAATLFGDITSTTPILASMLGLAVGIDYALFILARYRNELEHTDDREEAVGVAVGTAGSAVVFAGLTVIIALVALAVVRIPFLTSMGVAAAATVAVAVLVALTLLPAILGALKSKAFAGRVRQYKPRREGRHVLNNGVQWARLVGRAPVVAVLLVVVVLGTLAIPLGNLHLAFPTDSTASIETTQRRASDLVSAAFGPGRESPMVIVVDGRHVEDPQARQAAYGEVLGWAAGQDDVTNVQVVAMNEEGTGAQLLLTPRTGPEDTETEELLQQLRETQGDVERSTGTEIGVTGLTPITVDVSERLAGALPVYLAVVIGLAFILLMLVFRSLLVPLTATLGFLLSVLATLGVTVAIFQEGYFGIMEGQPIVSFMPIFLIGVVFGLAMDYQVFLVTRVREAHIHGATFREAVVDGFRNSARVVTAAALIMTSVFAAFVMVDEPIVKSMGFALAIAVLFDAFLVRMVLIPALLYLMQDKAWWLPGWLDRILPRVDVEGESLDRPHLEEHYRQASSASAS